jgi:hypothetical protein
MPKRIAIFSVVAALATALLPGTAIAAYPRATEEKNTVSVSNGSRPVLRYRHSDVPMKPYVDQLHSPAGVQVLRDSPEDHQHHHALMFATAVDGVDFWSELPHAQFGTQKQRSLKVINYAVPDGIGLAGFSAEVAWIGPASDKPLLAERRRVCVLEDNGLASPGLGATLVQWQSSLQPPPGKESVVLTGSHYFGLGMRFVESMDGGRFFNADDKAGEVVRGDERLTPVKWCAYTAKADGKPVTVAVFDHPKNLRYPAKMFTMTQPFAYLSATRNEWKEPITIKAGAPLDLRYAIAVWDGEVDKPVVEKLYQRWLELSKYY